MQPTFLDFQEQPVGMPHVRSIGKPRIHLVLCLMHLLSAPSRGRVIKGVAILGYCEACATTAHSARF